MGADKLPPGMSQGKAGGKNPNREKAEKNSPPSGLIKVFTRAPSAGAVAYAILFTLALGIILGFLIGALT